MRKVILDCDPGHDDAFAIMLAAQHLDLLGVTTVGGNGYLPNVTRNALVVLEQIGHTEIPVYPGHAGPSTHELVTAPNVHGKSGMDGPVVSEPLRKPERKHAVDFIVETVMNTDDVTLIATGPLTNIAAALNREPRIAQKAAGLYIMGGGAYAGKLEFLQGGFARYGDYALVATKGACFEGPFYLDRRGRILGWDEENAEQARKLVTREAERLRAGLEEAKAAGCRKLLIFLHYPPTSILEEESVFTRLAEEYGAEQLVYAHIHGETRYGDSIRGDFRGLRYSLVSGDYLKWQPLKLLD